MSIDPSQSRSFALEMTPLKPTPPNGPPPGTAKLGKTTQAGQTTSTRPPPSIQPGSQQVPLGGAAKRSASTISSSTSNIPAKIKELESPIRSKTELKNSHSAAARLLLAICAIAVAIPLIAAFVLFAPLTIPLTLGIGGVAFLCLIAAAKFENKEAKVKNELNPLLLEKTKLQMKLNTEKLTSVSNEQKNTLKTIAVLGKDRETNKKELSKLEEQLRSQSVKIRGLETEYKKLEANLEKYKNFKPLEIF